MVISACWERQPPAARPPRRRCLATELYRPVRSTNERMDIEMMSSQDYFYTRSRHPGTGHIQPESGEVRRNPEPGAGAARSEA